MNRNFHLKQVASIAAMILLPMIILSFGYVPKKLKTFSRLSEYKLFQGELKLQQPAENVLPYDLNMPLFSDYAYKDRFIRLPDNSKIKFDSLEVFKFPVGTILVKSFYYPKDFRKPEKEQTLIETRLLIHQPGGWEALTYVWNEEQTEAFLEVGGDSRQISWIDLKGKKRSILYSIPNQNQCKGCHEYTGEFAPIGPSARQLNRIISYKGQDVHQLELWHQRGMISDLPPSIETMPRWDDAGSGTTESRARAYLDINCGHCHRAEGPAFTSGLFLNIRESDRTRLGIFKAPVAAGKGSGDRKYAIEPGYPDRSILIYRMESLDPGIMMPEMGRKTIHSEGIELLKEWIRQLK